MGDGFRTYEGDKKDVEEIAKIQEAALDLTTKHLLGPLDTVVKSKLYGDQAIASALLMLAYHILRGRRSARLAEDAFNVQAHFAKLRIERGIEAKERNAASVN